MKRSGVGGTDFGRNRLPSPGGRGSAGGRGAGGEGLLLLLFLLGLFGCGERQASSPTAQAVPQRIVALAPNLTETLFALGLGDRVVGVGDYSTYPPEALTRPRLGGLFDANLERVVSLEPDLAVLLPSEQDLAAKLKPLGVEVLVVPNETLADIERSFGVIAERCGVPEAGARLAAQWRTGLAPRPVSAVPGRPRVLISAGRKEGSLSGLVVAGPDTFFQELLDRLGAVNVFADAPVRYPQVSLEEVIARAPDVIVELRAEAVAPEVARQLARDWDVLGNVPAVRQGRVRLLAGDYVVIPGPRLPRLYAELREILLPDPPSGDSGG